MIAVLISVAFAVVLLIVQAKLSSWRLVSRLGVDEGVPAFYLSYGPGLHFSVWAIFLLGLGIVGMSGMPAGAIGGVVLLLGILGGTFTGSAKGLEVFRKKLESMLQSAELTDQQRDRIRELLHKNSVDLIRTIQSEAHTFPFNRLQNDDRDNK